MLRGVRELRGSPWAWSALAEPAQCLNLIVRCQPALRAACVTVLVWLSAAALSMCAASTCKRYGARGPLHACAC